MSGGQHSRHGRPGDLGRRVRRRREELGLSRAELAARSGMAEQYVAHLEEEPAHFPSGRLGSLARALEVPESVLLGTDVDIPPGRQRAARHARLRVLGEEECWQLLGERGIGRIAFTAQPDDVPDAPLVFPVNYAVVDGTIVARVEPGRVIDVTLDRAGGHPASLQVDRVDEAQREGWSVLVRGHADVQTASGFGPELPVQPWAGGARSRLARLHPQEVTGRRIHAT